MAFEVVGRASNDSITGDSFLASDNFHPSFNSVEAGRSDLCLPLHFQPGLAKNRGAEAKHFRPLCPPGHTLFIGEVERLILLKLEFV